MSSGITEGEQPELLQNQNKGILLVIAGPTAVGKNTVVGKIEELYKKRVPPIEFARIVAYTDREKRLDEVEGIDYHFITKDAFSKMADRGEFFSQGTYGESRKALAKDAFHSVLEGKNQILMIDMNYAAQLPQVLSEKLGDEAKDLLEKTVLVIIGTPTLITLKDRYLRREKENRPSLLPRLRGDWESWNKYKSNFANVVVNEEGKLNQTVSTITNLIDERVLKVARR